MELQQLEDVDGTAGGSTPPRLVLSEPALWTEDYTLDPARGAGRRRGPDARGDRPLSGPHGTVDRAVIALTERGAARQANAELPARYVPTGGAFTPRGHLASAPAPTDVDSPVIARHLTYLRTRNLGRGRDPGALLQQARRLVTWAAAQ